MPRSEEADSWFYAVYSAVQEIPYGHVTSYGHIAKLLDQRSFVPFSLPFLHARFLPSNH